MYSWNNRKNLNTLKARGIGDVIRFQAGPETAEVYLQGNDIAKVVYSTNKKSTIILKKDRYHVIAGEGNTKRDVYHYLLPNGPAPTMRLGITKHSSAGTWSSLPHDFELQTEPGFEEVFFYLVKGSTNKAIQVGRGVWWNNTKVDSCWFVSNRSFSTIPMGYHPVVAEPGVYVSYVWAYLAKKKKWEKI